MMITLKVEIDVIPEDPGRLFGPPEDCYPPTPAEYDLSDIYCPEAMLDLTGKVHIDVDALEEIMEGLPSDDDLGQSQAAGAFSYRLKSTAERSGVR
jgi:hypothetical protein